MTNSTLTLTQSCIKREDNQFINGLFEEGLLWSPYPHWCSLKTWAKRGDNNDWAAYVETPYPDGNQVGRGMKLPQDVAEDIYPEWAESDLHWRV